MQDGQKVRTESESNNNNDNKEKKSDYPVKEESLEIKTEPMDTECNSNSEV